MFKWAQGALSVVAGTQEPEYGAEAIHSVGKQTEKTPFTRLSKQDQKWQTPATSCVETQTFYVYSDDGPFGFVQVIYSNVAIATTCQFNTQLYFPGDAERPSVWSSDPLTNWKVDDDKYNFSADKMSIQLNEDGTAYTIKSSTNLQSVVELNVTRTTPAFVIGNNGTTVYGTDEKNPWGSMRHSFWPRCKVEGHVLTKSGEVKLDGIGMYSHALQGMKPHHCAARWNFVNFQSPSYSAIMMEFTTPPSYGNTVINVGSVASTSDILFAGANNSATHTEIKGDPEVDWPEPGAVKYVWSAKTEDGKDAEAELEGSLGKRLNRIDVMGELPAFVKQLASAAAGTRPYIYQYAPKMKLKLKIGDEVKEEEGRTFIEATFIS